MHYIFDWDGTLSNSLAKIVGSFQLAAKALDLPVKADRDVRQIIGLGLNEGIEILYPGNGQEMLQRIREYYSKHYREIATHSEELYDGAFETLSKLHQQGHTLTVATGKGRVGLDRAMKQSNTEDFFVFTRTADDAPSKPHPQMILDILDYTGVDASDAVMIGDTEFDLEMAKNAGVRSIGTSYGAHAVEQLHKWNPITIIDSIDQLLTTEL